MPLHLSISTDVVSLRADDLAFQILVIAFRMVVRNEILVVT
jgi:hypothetical protein